MWSEAMSFYNISTNTYLSSLEEPAVSGILNVSLDDGTSIEVEAQDYINTLKAEAESLKAALAAESRDSTANMGLTAGLDPGSPDAGGGLGGYLASLNKENVQALTEGITPEVIDTMKVRRSALSEDEN